MDFDFNLILVPLTIVLGFIWLLDKLTLKQRKTRGRGKESLLVRWAYDFFPVLAVVLVVRSFLIEPFNIPSSSMVPTLYTGDFIAVNKYAYGVRLPLTYNKVLDTGQPEHGDVAVFRYPENPSIYYIKRVIGLPGDTVSYNQGQISINTVPVDTKSVNFDANAELTAQLYPAGQVTPGQVFTETEATQMGQQEEEQAQYFQETQGENKHLVRYLADMNSSQYAPFLQQQSPEVVSSAGTEWQVTVPDGEYFVMGDNRDRSADGRFWGFVPDENLAGKAVYIWMHKPPGLNLPTFSRNGSID